jgi:hypothetical protein
MEAPAAAADEVAAGTTAVVVVAVASRSAAVTFAGLSMGRDYATNTTVAVYRS